MQKISWLASPVCYVLERNKNQACLRKTPGFFFLWRVKPAVQVLLPFSKPRTLSILAILPSNASRRLLFSASLCSSTLTRSSSLKRALRSTATISLASVNSWVDSSSSSSLVWLMRDSAAWRRVCSRVSRVSRSAEDCEAVVWLGDAGCDVDRRELADGSSDDSRDWRGARVFAEVGRTGGEGGARGWCEEVDFSSRSSSS